MTVYSERLGDISDAQFAAVVTRAGLGAFRSAAPITTGLFGQNVFLTTTSGEFVFRGAPHWWNGGPNDAWQFPKERFYATLMHERTKVPVAHPQILDRCDVFPWPYLIMPRLPGVCLDDPAQREGLSGRDFAAVAGVMGTNLAAMQRLTNPFAGDFDPAVGGLIAFEGGYHAHIVSGLTELAQDSSRSGSWTADDDDWLQILVAADRSTPERTPAVYAHNDYALGNVLFQRATTGWRVSGVIDLMTSCFGDPAADLVRITCQFLDTAPALATAFHNAYRATASTPPSPPARLALLTAYERLAIWTHFSRPPHPSAFTVGTTFRRWAEPYLEQLLTMT